MQAPTAPSMHLLFLYGLPATGKLTIARELAALTGYKLFHNHLAVDLLLSTFDFGSNPFIELREQIWLSVFDHAARTPLPGLIFTFNPETTVSRTFPRQAIATITRHNGSVDCIELICPLEELSRRLDTASRRSFGKLTSLPLFHTLHAAGTFDCTHMPPPRLTIDTSATPPSAAAARIVETLNLPTVAPRPGAAGTV